MRVITVAVPSLSSFAYEKALNFVKQGVPQLFCKADCGARGKILCRYGADKSYKTQSSHNNAHFYDIRFIAVFNADVYY